MRGSAPGQDKVSLLYALYAGDDGGESLVRIRLAHFELELRGYRYVLGLAHCELDLIVM